MLSMWLIDSICLFLDWIITVVDSGDGLDLCWWKMEGSLLMFLEQNILTGLIFLKTSFYGIGNLFQYINNIF